MLVPERPRGKAKQTPEEVAHGVGVGEAGEGGDTIKGKPCFRQKLLRFSHSVRSQLAGDGWKANSIQTASPITAQTLRSSPDLTLTAYYSILHRVF